MARYPLDAIPVTTGGEEIMNEHKFTKGPWEFDMAFDSDNGRETFAIYHLPEKNHIIEIVETPDCLGDDCIHGKNKEEQEANAKLIAAAPMLIEALEHITETQEFNQLYSGTRQLVLQSIRKALEG